MERQDKMRKSSGALRTELEGYVLSFQCVIVCCVWLLYLLLPFARVFLPYVFIGLTLRNILLYGETKRRETIGGEEE